MLASVDNVNKNTEVLKRLTIQKSITVHLWAKIGLSLICE